MTLLQILQTIPGYRDELKRLYERLTALQSMITISAPPFDREKVSSSKSPDKIGDYVVKADHIYQDIKAIQHKIRRIYQLISKYLDREKAQVIRLCYFLGLTTREAAGRLQVSQSTVSRYRRQAEKRLSLVIIT